MPFLLAVLCQLLAAHAAARTIYSLDNGWKVKSTNKPAANTPCPAHTWTASMDGLKTNGLKQSNAITESFCADSCCADDQCETYQFCNSSACGSGPPQQATCWIGRYNPKETRRAKGWIGQRRKAAPAPAPPVPGGNCTQAWCLPGTDDRSWESTSVPHDFVVGGVFSKNADKSHGYLPFGVGYYRKRVALPKAGWQGIEAGTHKVVIHFDGVQTHSTVYLDGEFLGTHASGYTPFSYELSESQARLLGGREGGALLAVKADATNPDGWWYDGGGVYRHVKLLVLPRTHIDYEGGAYLPGQVHGPITKGVADSVLSPAITVVHGDAATVEVGVTLFDPKGKRVGSTSASFKASAPGNTTVKPKAVQVPKALLWSPDSPSLYTVNVTVSDLTAGTTDTTMHTIGFRKTAWSTETGFSLNDVPTKLLGAANHQDFAGVGVAVPDVLQGHRVAKLKQMGGNAWRTAHNPPTPALLDAADRLGFLVWDENHRNGQDDELRRMVLRDRNHPSIVIWSICNEKLCDSSNTEGDARRMRNLFHSLDPLGGRVVSANYNPWVKNDTPLDLMGIDYSTTSYDHSNSIKHPKISSETSSAVSDRAIYENNATAGHVTGYDTEHPGWGQTAEGAWGGIGEKNGEGILTRPFVSGGFTWTGWDYKGEPTPDSWPDINSHFGIIDEAGFEKDRFYWYQAWFKKYRAGEGIVHLFPHWNWEAGKQVNMWAFSNAASVELLVNNKSHGVKPMTQYAHVEWDQVGFEPGAVTAVAYDSSNRTIGVHRVQTTGAAHALRLSIRDGVGSSAKDGHAGGIIATCNDVALVMVEVVDAEGRVVPTANNNVTLSHTGAARYLGGGNGDPADHTADHSLWRRAFGGLLLGVYGSTDKPGVVQVRASSPGLVGASLSVKSRAPAFQSKWWCSRQPEL